MIIKRNCSLKVCLTVFLVSAGIFGASAEKAGPNEIRFIKGSLTDKTAAVKEASGEETARLSVKAIDFVLENSQTLGEDRDLSALALAGILTLPQNTASEEVYKKLYKLFSLFTDSTDRIAVIDKIVQFNKTVPSADSVAVLRSFVETDAKAGTTGTDVHKAAVTALGSIGDGASLSVLYECYVKKIWPQYQNDIASAIEKLADKSLPELIKIISRGDIADLSAVYGLIINSKVVTDSFKSEIAENILSELLYMSESDPAAVSELQPLEFNCVDVIAKNNWTRASVLVLKFFAQAKSGYTASTIAENQFISAIQATASLSSTDAAKTLADYLGELNALEEKGTKVSPAVALAVINALGTLGNKSSFDYLLYVTYLDYPDEVIAAARNALTKLKW